MKPQKCFSLRCLSNRLRNIQLYSAAVDNARNLLLLQGRVLKDRFDKYR